MSEPKQPPDPPSVDREAFFVRRMSDALVERLARGRVYYGWYIVAVVVMVGIPRVGFNGQFFGIFLKPLSEEFGWTRSETTWAVTIGTLIAAGLGIILGRVLDRYGPRWMFVGGCALLAGSFFGLSRINTLVLFYLVYSVGRSMMQSATGHTLSYALVSKWFVRRRATALSAATFGGFLGGVFLAPVVQQIINSYGWREAWVFFGALTLVLALVPALLLLRRIPEDLGLLPDGVRGEERLPPSRGTPTPASGAASQDSMKPVGTAEAGLDEMSLTMREAVHTISFWLLTLMVTLASIATTGVNFHLVPHFSDAGISDTVAASTISMTTFTAVASVFGWGFLADRLGAKRILLTVLLTLAFGTLLVARADTTTSAYVSAGVFGLGMGGYGLLSEVVWANFFGRKYLGSIRGVSMVFQLGGNASGSLIAAYLFDQRGNYDDAFKVIIAALTASFAMLLVSRRPNVKRIVTREAKEKA